MSNIQRLDMIQVRYRLWLIIFFNTTNCPCLAPRSWLHRLPFSLAWMLHMASFITVIAHYILLYPALCNYVPLHTTAVAARYCLDLSTWPWSSCTIRLIHRTLSKTAIQGPLWLGPEVPDTSGGCLHIFLSQSLQPSRSPGWVPRRRFWIVSTLILHTIRPLSITFSVAPKLQNLARDRSSATNVAINSLALRIRLWNLYRSTISDDAGL